MSAQACLKVTESHNTKARFDSNIGVCWFSMAWTFNAGRPVYIERQCSAISRSQSTRRTFKWYAPAQYHNIRAVLLPVTLALPLLQTRHDDDWRIISNGEILASWRFATMPAMMAAIVIYHINRYYSMRLLARYNTELRRLDCDISNIYSDASLNAEMASYLQLIYVSLF